MLAKSKAQALSSIDLITIQSVDSLVVTPTALCKLYVDDINLEDVESSADERLFQYEDYLVVVDAVEDRDSWTIYDCDVTSNLSKRAAALEIGLGALKGRNVNDVLYGLVQQGFKELPNYWIIATFDYHLGLNGLLTTALDDYSVTNIVVNSRGSSLSRLKT